MTAEGRQEINALEQLLADATKTMEEAKKAKATLEEILMKINAAQDELSSAEKEVKDVRCIKSECKVEDEEDTDTEDEESNSTTQVKSEGTNPVKTETSCKVEEVPTDNEAEETQVKVEEDNKCNRNDGSDKKTLSRKKRKESSTSSAAAAANTTTKKASAAATAATSSTKKKEKNKDKTSATTSSKKQKTAKDNTNNEEEMVGAGNLKSREVLSDQLEKQTHARLAVNRNDGSVHQPTALFILARDKKNKNVRFRKNKPGCARVKDNKQLDIDMTNLSNKEDKMIGQHARRLHEDFNFQKKESKEKISRRPGPKTPEWTDYYHVDFTTLENARKISRSDNYKKAARSRQTKNRLDKIGSTNEESKMNDDGEAIPKPPLNAYMDYSSSIRPKIKEENPNATPTEMVTLIAVAYKALDEGTLQKFKVEASKKMAEYKAKYGEEALTKYKRQVKKDKDEKKKDRGEKKRKSSAAIS